MREIILQLTMWVVTLCTYISYIPQLVKLFKTKKSEDLSAVSWVLWTVGSLANVVYAVILGRYELIIAGVSEFILILLTLILTIRYNRCEWEIQHTYGYGISCICSCDSRERLYQTPSWTSRLTKCRNCGRRIVLTYDNQPLNHNMKESLKTWKIL